MNWTRVENELPKYDHPVLVSATNDGGEPFIIQATFNPRRGWEALGSPLAEVLGWAEMPQPLKE